MSTSALSRKHCPIGGASSSVVAPAWWRAVQTYASWVSEAVRRRAWADDAGVDLLVAHQAGQDRQAGGVGRGRFLRTQVVRGQIEACALEGRPRAIGPRSGNVELEQQARPVPDHDHMAVAGPIRPALDRSVLRDGQGSSGSRPMQTSREVRPSAVDVPALATRAWSWLMRRKAWSVIGLLFPNIIVDCAGSASVPSR